MANAINLNVTVSSLVPSYPVWLDSSKNLVPTNTAQPYAFGTSNPTIDTNADTAINLISSVSTKVSQLNIANSGLGSGITLWSGRTSDTNSAYIWANGTDMRFATQTSGQVATAGFIERFRMASSTGDFTIFAGHLVINQSGKGLNVRSSNVSAGVANTYFIIGVTLVGGTVTISNNVITTACSAVFTPNANGGTPGSGYRVLIGTGTVTVTSTSVLDTSTGTISIIKGI